MLRRKKISLSLVLMITMMAIVGILKYTKAGNNDGAQYGKVYLKGDNIYFGCPDGEISPPENFNVDFGSVKILSDSFFSDKNNVYVAWLNGIGRSCGFNIVNNADPDSFEILNYYYEKDKNNVFFNSYYRGGPFIEKMDDADAGSFTVLGGGYAKDKNNIYYGVAETMADMATFEVFKEDVTYAMDKNNMYFYGEILNDQGETITNEGLYDYLKGKIILKAETKGEAYYIHPITHKMFFLSKPVVAFYIMREQGIGITNQDLEKIPVAENYCPDYSPNCDNKDAYDPNFVSKHKGKIFLQVEEKGEAWYVNPADSKRYFLGRPADAFNIMRKLGLGVSNNDFERLTN